MEPEGSIPHSQGLSNNPYLCRDDNVRVLYCGLMYEGEIRYLR